jgi:hypothetical protein
MYGRNFLGYVNGIENTGGTMPLNNAAYGMEVQEYSMDLSLRDPSQFEIEDRIWMQRTMSFDTIDLQKHQKKNHFTARRSA